MRVLMFGWEFPPHITGGLGTACLGLTKGLLNNDVEVIFVVPKVYGDEAEEIHLVNASDVRIDIHNKIHEDHWKNISYIEVDSILVPYSTPEQFYRILNEQQQCGEHTYENIYSLKYNFSGKYGENLMEEVARYALVATEIAQKQQFDVIHAHDWLTYPAAIAAKNASNKPLIVHVHATEFDRSGEHVNQNVYDIERRGMHEADKIITVSNFTRQIVIDRYNIHPDKVVTVHNAVDLYKNQKDSTQEKYVREKIVTFMGRVTFQKGPDYFVEAAYKVLQKDKNVRFVMAGSGDMLNKMIKRVAELRISKYFHFTGFLKGDDVNRMFAISDVYVMPSVSEPFGISPLEAMRSNVPVVISKQSGVSEVLHHALKVDFWDIDAMADSIYGLLHYNALSKMFISMGKSEVESLKWDNSAHRVKEIYLEVTANKEEL